MIKEGDVITRLFYIQRNEDIFLKGWLYNYRAYYFLRALRSLFRLFVKLAKTLR